MVARGQRWGVAGCREVGVAMDGQQGVTAALQLHHCDGKYPSYNAGL